MPDYLIHSDALGYPGTFYTRAASPQMAHAALRRVIRQRDHDHAWARYEHAFLLRCEGLLYREVGDHLGVTIERARQMVSTFARRLQRAVNRVHVR